MKRANAGFALLPTVPILYLGALATGCGEPACAGRLTSWQLDGLRTILEQMSAGRDTPVQVLIQDLPLHLQDQERLQFLAAGNSESAPAHSATINVVLFIQESERSIIVRYVFEKPGVRVHRQATMSLDEIGRWREVQDLMWEDEPAWN